MKRKKIDLGFLLTEIFFDKSLTLISFIFSLIIVYFVHLNLVTNNKNPDVFSVKVKVESIIVGDYIPQEFSKSFNLIKLSESEKILILKSIRNQYLMTEYLSFRESFHLYRKKLYKNAKKKNYRVSNLNSRIIDNNTANILFELLLTKTSDNEINVSQFNEEVYYKEIKTLIEKYFDEHVDINKNLAKYYFFNITNLSEENTKIYKHLSSIVFLTILINIMWVFFKNRKIIFKLID
jgi:hypothetical protein